MPHTWHDALDPRKIRSSADISIHMPHTWHDYAAWADAVRKIISIHMPHTWHDLPSSSVVHPFRFISIHMPHTWHDRIMQNVTFVPFGFQSTCHIRGMTVFMHSQMQMRTISIHMPHTWHDLLATRQNGVIIISIHMPHTWHDVFFCPAALIQALISIHMPHTWHDRYLLQYRTDCDNFNPHATYVA